MSGKPSIQSSIAAKLARAVAQSVPSIAAHHGAAPCGAAQPGAARFSSNIKNEPKPSRAAGVERGGPQDPAHHGAAPCSAAQHGAASFSSNLQNEPKTLTETQLAAIRLLLAGKRPTFIARELNIHRQTLVRWRRQPLFAAMYQNLFERLCSGRGSVLMPHLARRVLRP